MLTITTTRMIDTFRFIFFFSFFSGVSESDVESNPYLVVATGLGELF